MNTLRRGVQGPDVVTWLNILTQSPVPTVWTDAAGVSHEWKAPWPLPQSFTFDENVELATQAWQFSRGLVADGIVGPNTWNVSAKRTSIVVPPSIALVKGTDSSAIQQKIDVPSLVKDGISFGWCRCVVGNNAGRDSLFESTVTAFADNGIAAGGYCFLFPLPHIDPIEQAKMFLKGMLVKADVVGTMLGQLPIAIDLEWPAPENWHKYGCTPDQVVDYMIAVCEYILAQTGIRPVIYSYPYFLQCIAKAKNYAELCAYKLWIAGGAQYINGSAQWPNLATYMVPRVPGWGTDWLFNQWDGNGGKRYANGMDADFNIYRFDQAALDAYTQAKQPTAPDTLPTMRSVLNDIATYNAVPDAVHTYRQDRANAFILQPV